MIPLDLAYIIRLALSEHGGIILGRGPRETGRDHAVRFDVEDEETGEVLTIIVERAYVPMTCAGAS